MKSATIGGVTNNPKEQPAIAQASERDARAPTLFKKTTKREMESHTVVQKKGTEISSNFYLQYPINGLY
jgi:hypothetical protein